MANKSQKQEQPYIQCVVCEKVVQLGELHTCKVDTKDCGECRGKGYLSAPHDFSSQCYNCKGKPISTMKQKRR